MATSPDLTTPTAQSAPILYLDPFSGVAGDMFVAALLDLGLELPALEAELAKLRLDGFHLQARRVLRRGVAATQFLVETTGAPEAHGHAPHARKSRAGRAHARAGQGLPAHAHRSFADIRALIVASSLSATVQERSLRVFSLLAEAEGLVHGKPPEQVHFHEVGALDSIVDIVGACAGLELLGISEVRCGPIAVGGPTGQVSAAGKVHRKPPAAGPHDHRRHGHDHGHGGGEELARSGDGYVRCAHGLFPVPALATLELLKGLPLRDCPVSAELTTPTGAALVRGLCAAFGPLAGLEVVRIGYGAGSRDDADNPLPNVLRAVLGKAVAAKPAPASAPQALLDLAATGVAGGAADQVYEIQANLDDVTPEVLAYVAERLLAQGALDVFLTPIQMKKGRPGTLLTVLVEATEAALGRVAGTLFHETPTFGLRYTAKSRLKLAREFRKVATPWGAVRVKVGTWQGQTVSAHPEFADCRALAEQHGVPLRAVVDAATHGCGGRTS